MTRNKYLALCIKAVEAGGLAIKDIKREVARTKADKYVGHHAVVSSADFKSQAAILGVFKRYDPNAYFMTEEHVNDSWFRNRLIARDNIDLIRGNRTYIIDELDGSSSHNAHHPEWAVSIACLDGMEHIAGAVFAPDIWSGTLFSGIKGGGAFIKEDNKKRQRIHVVERSLKEAYLILGPDNFLSKYPTNNKFVYVIADRARTINSRPLFF